jgi:citrate synthase
VPKAISSDEVWLSTAEACALLGIRSQTLYAYVSRGVLNPRREGRRSFFRLDELERVESKGKRYVRPGRVEASIDSAVTLVVPAGRLYYRGADVAELAESWSYERTAEWLWSGQDNGEPDAWPAFASMDVIGHTPVERVRSAVAKAAAQASGLDPSPDLSGSVGRRLLPQLVSALEVVGPKPLSPKTKRAPLAEQLWPRLSRLPATPERLAALNCALVVFADHELVPSTIAARMAAAASASPFDAILAAMSTHAGVARRGFRTSIESALLAGIEPAGAFDQEVYAVRDPRADALVPFIAPASSAKGWELVEHALADERPPSAELAVAALSVACEMVSGSAEAIYSIGRVAGLLAHTAEEYAHPSVIRARAGYRGTPPSDVAIA